MGCFFPAYGFSCGIYIRYLDIPPAVWYNIAIMGREIFRDRMVDSRKPISRSAVVSTQSSLRMVCTVEVTGVTSVLSST